MVFRLRPPLGPFIFILFVLALGAFIAWLKLGTERARFPEERALGYLAIAIAVVISGLTLLVATSKLWFTHLWPKKRRRH